MGRLNRDPIPEQPKRSRLSRITWRDMYPKFPIMHEEDSPDLPEEKRLYVWCRKGGKRSGECIRLDVCLHSVFRFNPTSRRCRECFHLKKGQHFPSLFLEAKRVPYLPETGMVKMDEDVSEETENGKE